MNGDSGGDLFVERFRAPLEIMERERIKLVRDRKAYLFLIGLMGFMGALCLLSGAFGPSRFVLAIGLVLIFVAEVVRRLRASLDGYYQAAFRAHVTRDWFHWQFPTWYLAPAPAAASLPLEVKRGLREACIRATGQRPSLTSIEERIFSDSDSAQVWTFILRELSWWTLLPRSRAIVWFRGGVTFGAGRSESGAFGGVESARIRDADDTLVAYAWPPVTGLGGPDVRFFENGVVASAREPLRSRLVEIYELIRARSGGAAARVSLSPNGWWAGAGLRELPFRAPVTLSCLDARAYATWLDEAALLINSEIPRKLGG